MSSFNPKKIATSESKDLTQTPFAALSLSNLSSTSQPTQATPLKASESTSTLASATPQFKGRIDLRRETQGRHGKTVTTITPQTPLPESDAKDLTHFLKNQLGCGGTFKENHIELQGDRRDQAKPILEKLGFRVVLSGG
jgi:translation initiation factor 1